MEGFDQVGLSIAKSGGGKFTTISTAKGCVSGNFDSATLADAWMQSGANCVEQLGTVGKPWQVWNSDLDAFFVGSKPGAMSGGLAALVTRQSLPLQRLLFHPSQPS